MTHTQRPAPWWRPALLALVVGVLAATQLVTGGTAPVARAQSVSTVSQGIAAGQGTALQVRGYVVGQPTAQNTVVRNDFPNDFALALADSPSTTDTARMLYVQIPSALRSQHGLATNPGRMGTLITVSGTRDSYFSHAGITSVTSITGSASTPPPSSTDYYSGASGRNGSALQDALHDIISRGTSTLTYDQVWAALRRTDVDATNPDNVRLFYSGVARGAASNGGDQDDWNREHVWPQSHGDFGTGRGPGTDLHHLRPTDVTVNAVRGNKDFDAGGSAVSECSGCLTDGDSFSPRAAVRGDVARMIFYMSVRYEGGDGFADLEVNDRVGNGSAPATGRLSVLLDWHAQDPPDAGEQRRNEIIFDDYQGNRNPFIDHPEYAAAIWG